MKTQIHGIRKEKKISQQATVQGKTGFGETFKNKGKS